MLSVVGKDRDGHPMEFGQGVWAGEWTGGGAFAVGVKDWVESDAATLKGMWDQGSSIVGVGYARYSSCRDMISGDVCS